MLQMKHHLFGNFVTDKIFISPQQFSVNFQMKFYPMCDVAQRYTLFNGHNVYNLHSHLMAARHDHIQHMCTCWHLALHFGCAVLGSMLVTHVETHIESGDIVIIIEKLLANYGHKYH